MLCAVVLLQLTIWVGTIEAFFPWVPEYVCANDTGCEVSAEAIHGRASQTSSKVTTYKLSQRIPEADVDNPTRAAREAGRLLRKYAPGDPPRTTGLQPDLARRDNGYPVVTPQPVSGKDAAGIYQDGTDFCYFIQADVGSEKTALYMLLDTGAGTTWVMGSDCGSSACKLHSSFSPSGSDTYGSEPKSFSVAYGSGSVSGNLGRDTILLAGLDVSMMFGIANETSDDFNNFPFDGILGLSMSSGGTDNFLRVLKDDHITDSVIFGVSLSRNSDGANTGEIDFGGTDASKYTGDISYTPISSRVSSEWAIPMSGVAYDGKPAGVEGRLAYVDTGTTYVFGPPDDVAALHRLIPGAESSDNITYTVPCKASAPVAVSFSGVSFNISSEDWHSGSGGDGSCTSNIYGYTVVQDCWLLGDTFLKNVYAVFDADEERIGFAAKPGAPTQPTASTATAVPASGSSTATSATSTSSFPGIGGQESPSTSGSPAAQTSRASATSLRRSPAGQLSNKCGPILGAAAAAAVAAAAAMML